MARSLHDQVLAALTDRNTWENKQRLWYTMRHEGLPRRSKPFPGAADLHLPLGDNAIEKQKPFYINSVFSRQRLASFTPLQSDQQDASASAEQALDWKLRNESNYERQFDYLIDSKLANGRGVLKIIWDTLEDRLHFDSVDPIFFIVPKNCGELQEADWVCHVQPMSVAAYERDGRYDPKLIQQIRGGQEQVDRQGKEQEKATREGITYSASEDTIVLWQVWERKKSGWMVHTYSPCAPDDPVRPSFMCPYKRRGKPFLPFVGWQWEVTEKGWYAPRGVVEKVAPYETYGTKLWNSKADFLEYAMKPLFATQPGYEVKNTASIRIRPGEVLPPGLAPTAMPPPPMAIDNEITATREIAEEAVQSPDFGQTREGSTRESRTATELNYVQSFASQAVQYRAHISAQSEGETYGMAWALLVQFGGKELVYFSSNDRKVLPPEALHDNYLIGPDQQADAWNRTLRVQRATARLGMFREDPDIDQIELKRSVLEADDPRLVDRLLIGRGTKQADEREDEAKDILLLEALWPAEMIAMKPSEDHAVRLRVLFGRLDMLNKLGVPPNPLVARNIQAHAAQHLQMLSKQNPAMAKAFMQAIGSLEGGAGGMPGAPGSQSAGQGAGPGPELEAGAPMEQDPQMEEAQAV